MSIFIFQLSLNTVEAHQLKAYNIKEKNLFIYIHIFNMLPHVDVKYLFIKGLMRGTFIIEWQWDLNLGPSICLASMLNYFI